MTFFVYMNKQVN